MCFLPVCLLCFPFYNIHDDFRRASCSCRSATRSDPERVSRRADWDWEATPNPDCRAALPGSFLSGYHPSIVNVGAPPFLGRLKSKKHPRRSRTDKLRAPASKRNNPAGRTFSRWLLQAAKRREKLGDIHLVIAHTLWTKWYEFSIYFYQPLTLLYLRVVKYPPLIPKYIPKRRDKSTTNLKKIQTWHQSIILNKKIK